MMNQYGYAFDFPFWTNLASLTLQCETDDPIEISFSHQKFQTVKIRPTLIAKLQLETETVGSESSQKSKNGWTRVRTN